MCVCVLSSWHHDEALFYVDDFFCMKEWKKQLIKVFSWGVQFFEFKILGCQTFLRQQNFSSVGVNFLWFLKLASFLRWIMFCHEWMRVCRQHARYVTKAPILQALKMPVHHQSKHQKCRRNLFPLILFISHSASPHNTSVCHPFGGFLSWNRIKPHI